MINANAQTTDIITKISDNDVHQIFHQFYSMFFGTFENVAHCAYLVT